MAAPVSFGNDAIHQPKVSHVAQRFNSLWPKGSGDERVKQAALPKSSLRCVHNLHIYGGNFEEHNAILARSSSLATDVSYRSQQEPNSVKSSR